MLTVLIERCHWVDKCVELTILSFKSHLPDKHMRQSENLNNLQAISRKDFRRRTQLRMSRQKGDRCLWRNWVDDSLKMLHNVRIAWGQSLLKVHFGNGLIEYERRLISKVSRSLSQIECCWSEHGTSIRFHKKIPRLSQLQYEYPLGNEKTISSFASSSVRIVFTALHCGARVKRAAEILPQQRYNKRHHINIRDSEYET